MRSWEQKRLGEVLTLEYGKPLAPELRDPEGAVPVYGANGIKDWTHKALRSEPTIIVGRKGSAGEIQLTEGPFWPLDVTYFVEFDRQRYDLKFLYYLLDRIDLRTLAKGIKPGVNRNEAYDIRVSLPPLEEQRLIVAILDEAFAAIDIAAANAEKNVANVRSVGRRSLESLLTQRSNDWDDVAIAEVADIESGAAFPEHLQGKVAEAIPFFKVGDMNTPENETIMTVTNHTISEATRAQLRARIFPVGSVIFPKVGGAIATDKKRLVGVPCCVDNNVMGIIPRPELLEPRLLHQLMVIKPLTEFSNDAGLPSIRKSTVAAWRVRIPRDMLVQRRVADQLSALASSVTELSDVYDRKLRSLDALKQSLLRRAFSGEPLGKQLLAA